MTFATTYEEYQDLRHRLGYATKESPGMIKEVWDRCPPEAQENMLAQLRAPLESRSSVWYPNKHENTYGEVW